MDNSEKLQTENEKKANNSLIVDALDTLNILLKVGNERGLNIPEISVITSINKQALYRYSSDFESQTKSQPSVRTLSRLADALGYEIRLIKKRN